MEKDLVDVSKYLVVDDWSKKGKVLDSPEDIAAAEAINREMEVVSHKARNMFAHSAELVRGLALTRSR